MVSIPKVGRGKATTAVQPLRLNLTTSGAALVLGPASTPAAARVRARLLAALARAARRPQ